MHMPHGVSASHLMFQGVYQVSAVALRANAFSIVMGRRPDLDIFEDGSSRSRISHEILPKMKRPDQRKPIGPLCSGWPSGAQKSAPPPNQTNPVV
jgi:hypothetical protein